MNSFLCSFEEKHRPVIEGMFRYAAIYKYQRFKRKPSARQVVTELLSDLRRRIVGALSESERDAYAELFERIEANRESAEEFAQSLTTKSRSFRNRKENGQVAA